jgi:hypothetical protein
MYGPQKAMAQARAASITPPPPSSPSPSSSFSSSHPPTSSSPSSHAAPSSISPSSSSLVNTTTTATTTAASNFQTYKNPILGLKIEYPSTWSLRQHPYNATGNSTIATFISPAQLAASATTSASQGAQDTFIPYIDVFVFNSKDNSLDQLINGSVNNNKLLNATISQSKPITLNGGKPARMLEYSIIIAGRYLFDRMQVWTESGDKAFVISYTSEPQTYLTYLPTMQKMIRSLEIASTPTNEPGGSHIVNNSAQQRNDASSNHRIDASSSSSSSTIPWLPRG